MIKLGDLIKEDGLIGNGVILKRKTVRAIIINENNEVQMLYSKLFDDYTFPGGGIKKNESDIEALKRELHEELGALHVEIIKPFGYIEELRYGLKETDDIYLQTSYYYLCKIKEFTTPNLIGRELQHGLQTKWVTIDEAISKNESVLLDETHQKKGLKTVLLRENTVLKKLKENQL
ncbi:MAG: NUDIX domain-containing protein [Acholeplasmataceae bacterium]|nr:NUDIX domain-containing protein [Acholeplasmataceae bacterium]